MKRTLKALLSALALVMVMAGSTIASASDSVYGKVTFVGTLSEVYDGGNNAQFRIRVSSSTCSSDNTPKTRWIAVKSGRMDGIYQHNMANFKNAYNTVMTAFLTGSNVQIDQLASCTAGTLTLNKSSIGIY